MTPGDINFLNSLAPPDPTWQGTGALWRPDDPRDYQMARIPAVAEMLRVGFPENYSILDQAPGVTVLSQGQIPSCVWHTISHVQSINQFLERRQWQVFDAQRMHRETGAVNEGRWPDQMLKVAQEKGTVLAGDNKRYRVGSYAFAPKVSGAFEDTLKAAIATNRPCSLAMLLPQQFGWESGGQATSAYHAVALVGYRPDAFLLLNSWGSGWGRNGLGWIPTSFLVANNFQQGYVIPHTVIDAIDEDLAPPPPDPVGFADEVIRLTNAHRQSMGLQPLTALPGLMTSAKNKCFDMADKRYFNHVGPDGRGPLDWMKAAGVTNPSHWGENIAAGQVAPGETGAAVAWVGSAMRDGYLLAPGTVINSSSPGGVFQDWINSAGHRANIEFAAFTHIGVGFVNQPGTPYGTYWTQHFARIEGSPPPPPPPPPPTGVKISGTATGGGLEFLVPGVTLAASGGGFSGSIAVEKVEGNTDPIPPPPPPPTSLTVQIGQKRYSGGRLLVAASIRETSGRYLAGMLSGSAGSVALDAKQTTIGPSGAVPAVWFVATPAGAVIDIRGVAADGRPCSGQALAAPGGLVFTPAEEMMWLDVFGNDR